MTTPPPTLEEAARDLAQAHAALQAKLELLLTSSSNRDSIKHEAQQQLGLIEQHVVCVQDAIGYSIADELDASQAEAC